MMQATQAEILVHRKYYSQSVCPLYPPIHILHPVFLPCQPSYHSVSDTWNAVKPTRGQGTRGETAEQNRAIKEPLVTSGVTVSWRAY